MRLLLFFFFFFHSFPDTANGDQVFFFLLLSSSSSSNRAKRFAARFMARHGVHRDARRSSVQIVSAVRKNSSRKYSVWNFFRFFFFFPSRRPSLEIHDPSRFWYYFVATRRARAKYRGAFARAHIFRSGDPRAGLDNVVRRHEKSVLLPPLNNYSTNNIKISPIFVTIIIGRTAPGEPWCRQLMLLGNPRVPFRAAGSRRARAGRIFRHCFFFFPWRSFRTAQPKRQFTDFVRLSKTF